MEKGEGIPYLVESPHGGGGKKRGPEKLPPKAPTFQEIQALLKDPKLPVDKKIFLEAEKAKIIDDVRNFEEGRFLDDVRIAVIAKAKESEWDRVYGNLKDLGRVFDQRLQSTHGANLRWKGVIEQAVDSEAARAIVTGGFSQKWLEEQGYRKDTVDRLKTTAVERHVYDLLPSSPKSVVGKLLAPSPSRVAAKAPPPQPPIDTPLLAREIARAQGLLDPEQYLEDYRDAEEHLKAPFQIVPGAEPRFWVILNEKEKQEWVVRSTLVIAAYKKSMATGTDKLYMDEMRELAVDLNKRALKILFASRIKDGPEKGNLEREEYEGVDGVLPATSIYCTIIGDPRFYSLKDEERDFYIDKKTPTEVNLKRIFCGMKSKAEMDALVKDYGKEVADALENGNDKLQIHGRKDLFQGCPDSFFKHNDKWGKSIDQESFRILRESIRHWLVTKGRNLLLTEHEMSHREDFFNGIRWEKDGSRMLKVLHFGPNQALDMNSPTWKKLDAKQKAKILEAAKLYTFKELKDRARDAEQISWNFVYSTSVLEHFDSRDYRPPGTKRHGPSNFWTLFQWVPMHLVERLEQKTIRGDEGKEEWAGLLGTWALNAFKNGWWRKISAGNDSRGNPIVVNKLPEQILPDTMFRDALHPSIFQVNPIRQKDGKTIFDENNKNEKKGFFSAFTEVGNKVLDNPTIAKRSELENTIDWSEVSDSPFVPFIFDEMRWADVVQQVFKKGAGSKLGLADLGEACRNLRLTHEMREKLLMVYYGINSTARELKPKESKIDWEFRLAATKEYFPNYFLEK